MSASLRRKTPMRRGKPLRAGTPLKRKTPLKAASTLRRTRMKRKRPDREGKSNPAREAAIKQLGCIICGDRCRLHHTRHEPGRRMGTGMRNDDDHAFGLCKRHHQDGGYLVAIHAGQESWEARFGTEAELLAKQDEAIKEAGLWTW